jgi:predicted adenylyl cyclase CyaB
MPSNIEIKARVRDPERLRRLAERLSDTPPELLEQHDTFFPAPRGRLKLRQLSPGSGELIFYSRPDVAGARQSDYLIAQTGSPADLRAVLTAALGVKGAVTKTRRLLRVGQTRIHLDEVAGLGAFVELEVVLREGQTPEEGRRVARQLMTALGIDESDLVAGAYADLLAADAVQVTEAAQENPPLADGG